MVPSRRLAPAAVGKTVDAGGSSPSTTANFRRLPRSNRTARRIPSLNGQVHPPSTPWRKATAPGCTRPGTRKRGATSSSPCALCRFNSPATTLAQASLADEIRLIQAAHATATWCGCGRSNRRRRTTPAFLVEEPLAGFSLARLCWPFGGGTLAIEDTLRLLGAGGRGGRSRRKPPVWINSILPLHHLHVHFPYSDRRVLRVFRRPRLPDLAVGTQWPDWCLKVHPLASWSVDALEHHTWAGDVTLVPGVSAAFAGFGTIPRPKRSHARYVRRVASLAYETAGRCSRSATTSAGLPSVRNVSLVCPERSRQRGVGARRLPIRRPSRPATTFSKRSLAVGERPSAGRSRRNLRAAASTVPSEPRSRRQAASAAPSPVPGFPDRILPRTPHAATPPATEPRYLMPVPRVCHQSTRARARESIAGLLRISRRACDFADRNALGRGECLGAPGDGDGGEPCPPRSLAAGDR